jgi:hypothetical protein
MIQFLPCVLPRVLALSLLAKVQVKVQANVLSVCSPQRLQVKARSAAKCPPLSPEMFLIYLILLM